MITLEERPDPAVLIEKLAFYARMAAALPDEVATLTDVAFELLHGGPTISEREPWAHFADHVQGLVPAVMQDARVVPVLDAIDAEYARMVAESVTYFSGAKVGVLGAAAAVVVVVVVIGACIEGPHPEPGMSAGTYC